MKKLLIFSVIALMLEACTKELVYTSQDSVEPSKTIDSRTIVLDEAGTLRQQLGDDIGMSLTSLTVSGPINGTDLKFIREMAGADVEGKETGGHLVKLDLSQAIFVKGGDAPFIYKGELCQMEEDDAIPRYGFGYCKLKEIVLPDNITIFSDQAFFHCDSLQAINIPTSLQEMRYSVFCYCYSLSSPLFFPEKLTKLGNYTFYDCSSLTKISLSNSISSIGKSCFEGCSKLESFGTDFPKLENMGEFAFSKCRKIVTMNLPKTMNFVPKGAFNGCSALNSIDLSGKKIICKYAFYNCGKLTSLTFPEGMEVVEDSAFYDAGLSGSLVLPSTMKYIGLGAFYSTDISSLAVNSDIRTTSAENYTRAASFGLCNKLRTVKVSEGCQILDISFSNCTALTEVYLPTTLDSIGFVYNYSYYKTGESSAFKKCTALTKISLPSNLKYIGPSAFSGCTGLTEIIIPESVKTIDTYAFSDCTNLTNIQLPSKLQEISQGLLQNCISMVSIQLPLNISSIGYQAFEGSGVCFIKLPDGVKQIDSYAFRNCAAIKAITLPSSLEEIGNDAFSGCTNLSEVNVAENCKLKEISDMCFYQCTALTDISVPSMVESIGNYAFSTSGLSSILLPATVSHIGDGCFANCKRLETFVNSATIPQIIVASVFSGVDLKRLNLLVPAFSVSIYQGAEVWKDFGTISSF